MNITEIQNLHDSGKMFFITATGGGTSFIGEFLQIPGGSKCIVGGHIPYATQATDAFVGKKLEQYSNLDAARCLAVASFEQCTKLGFTEEQSVGVGVACSLIKDNERPNRKHVANIAIHTTSLTFSASIQYNNDEPNKKNTRSVRALQEAQTNNFILTILDKLCINKYAADDLKFELEKLYGSSFTINIEYAFNRFGFADYIVTGAISHIPKNDTLIIYPGSFNPLHRGHREIYDLACEINTGKKVFYELTVKNSYKPAIDYVDLNNRINQFQRSGWYGTAIITKAPRFVDKVKMFKEHFSPTEIIIVVGADTWERVYDEAAIKNGDIKFFEDNNVKFLVFGRGNSEIKNQDSRLFIKNDKALSYNNLISSSELRKTNKTVK